MKKMILIMLFLSFNAFSDTEVDPLNPSRTKIASGSTILADDMNIMFSQINSSLTNVGANTTVFRNFSIGQIVESSEILSEFTKIPLPINLLHPDLVLNNTIESDDLNLMFYNILDQIESFRTITIEKNLASVSNIDSTEDDLDCGLTCSSTNLLLSLGTEITLTENITDTRYERNPIDPASPLTFIVSDNETITYTYIPKICTQSVNDINSLNGVNLTSITGDLVAGCDYSCLGGFVKNANGCGSLTPPDVDYEIAINVNPAEAADITADPSSLSCTGDCTSVSQTLGKDTLITITPTIVDDRYVVSSGTSTGQEFFFLQSDVTFNYNYEPKVCTELENDLVSLDNVDIPTIAGDLVNGCTFTCVSGYYPSLNEKSCIDEVASFNEYALATVEDGGCSTGVTLKEGITEALLDPAEDNNYCTTIQDELNNADFITNTEDGYAPYTFYSCEPGQNQYRVNNEVGCYQSFQVTYQDLRTSELINGFEGFTIDAKKVVEGLEQNLSIAASTTSDTSSYNNFQWSLNSQDLDADSFFIEAEAGKQAVLVSGGQTIDYEFHAFSISTPSNHPCDGVEGQNRCTLNPSTDLGPGENYIINTVYKRQCNLDIDFSGQYDTNDDQLRAINFVIGQQAPGPNTDCEIVCASGQLAGTGDPSDLYNCGEEPSFDGSFATLVLNNGYPNTFTTNPDDGTALFFYPNFYVNDPSNYQYEVAFLDESGSIENDMTANCSQENYDLGDGTFEVEIVCPFQNIQIPYDIDNQSGLFPSKVRLVTKERTLISTEPDVFEFVEVGNVVQSQPVYGNEYIGYEFIVDNDSYYKSRRYLINQDGTDLSDEGFNQPLIAVQQVDENPVAINIDLKSLIHNALGDVKNTRVRLQKINLFQDNEEFIPGNISNYPLNSSLLSSGAGYSVRSGNGGARQEIRYDNPTEINSLINHNFTLPDVSVDANNKGFYRFRFDITNENGYRSRHFEIPFFLGETVPTDFSNFSQGGIDNNGDDLPVQSAIGNTGIEYLRFGFNMVDPEGIASNILIFRDILEFQDFLINGTPPACELSNDMATLPEGSIRFELTSMGDNFSNDGDAITYCNYREENNERIVEFGVTDFDKTNTFVVVVQDGAGEITYGIEEVRLEKSPTENIRTVVGINDLFDSNRYFINTANNADPQFDEVSLSGTDSEFTMLSKIFDLPYETMAGPFGVNDIVYVKHAGFYYALIGIEASLVPGCPNNVEKTTPLFDIDSSAFNSFGYGTFRDRMIKKIKKELGDSVDDVQVVETFSTCKASSFVEDPVGILYEDDTRGPLYGAIFETWSGPLNTRTGELSNTDPNAPLFIGRAMFVIKIESI